MISCKVVTLNDVIIAVAKGGPNLFNDQFKHSVLFGVTSTHSAEPDQMPQNDQVLHSLQTKCAFLKLE